MDCFKPLDYEEDSWMFWRGTPIPFEIPEGVTGPIHTVGDSHINILSEAMPDMFKTARYASISAYAVINPDNEFLFSALEKIPEGDKVLLSFGEIDCRHYIPKFAEDNETLVSELVPTIVERYARFITILQQKYRIIALSPYVNLNDAEHHENQFSQIIEAKAAFSALLRFFCEENGIAFVPLFDMSVIKGWHRWELGSYFNDIAHLGPCMIPIIFDSIKNFKWKGFI